MNKRILSQAALFVAAAALLIFGGTSCSPEKPAAPPPTDLVAEIHFIGANNIPAANTNYATFRDEFCSPQAHALQSQTLDKLSRAPAVWFKDKLPAGAGDGSAQLRPLLDDFFKSEWTLEMHDAPGAPEYALAIHLDATRAQLWQTNLRSLLESWTKIPARDIPGGWELKKDVAPNLFRFVRAGDWVVIGCGQNELPLSDKWSKAGAIPEHGTSWLTANLDWPRLAKIIPALAKFDFPAINLEAVGKDGSVLLTGTFNLSTPLPPLEKWQYPTNMVHQPLTSFAAARGFGPWLKNQSWAKWFALSPQPNQAFSWSLGLMPLQSFIAIPVPNATNALAQLGRNLSANEDWRNGLMSSFLLTNATDYISLQGVPFMAPRVNALRDSSGDFLFLNVFPNTAVGKPAPPGLFQAINKDNLVYYHWEDTPMRLKCLPELTQFALLMTRHRQLDADSAAAKWLNLIGPRLSASTTEVLQTGPQQLSFARNAPAGLTGLELIALANWLQATNFPGCDLRLPPPLKKPPLLHQPVKKLSSPVPAPAARH
jgi:hypothetical protein